jgi:hypothetical protein
MGVATFWAIFGSPWAIFSERHFIALVQTSYLGCCQVDCQCCVFSQQLCRWNKDELKYL